MDFKKSTNHLEKTLKLLAGTLIFTSIIVMSGWLLHISVLVQIVPTAVPMQFNTALCFCLSGIAILFYHKKKSLIVGFSLLIALIPSLTMLEYWLDINFGVDQLFIDPFTSTKTSDPGRMAPNTALSFIFFSIFLYFNQIKLARLAFIIMLLPALYGVLGLISIIGYVFNLEQAYAWGTLTHMAIHTGIGFVLLSIASFLLILTRHKLLKKQITALLDYAIFVSILFFFLMLWQVIKINYITTLKNETANQVMMIKAKFSLEIQRDLEAIIRLFNRFSSKSYTSLDALNQDVYYYFKHINPIESLSFNDKGHIIVYLNPFIYPRKNTNFFNELCGEIKQPNLTKKLSLEINEIHGYLCVRNNLSVAVINLKNIANKFIRENPSDFIIDFENSGNISHQNELYNQDETVFFGKTEFINIYGKNWLMTVTPSSKYIENSIGRIPGLVLSLGAFISFLVLFFLRYRRKVLMKERALLSTEAIKETIFNATLEGILGVNHHLQVYFMNRAAQQLLDINFKNKKTIFVNELVKNVDLKTGMLSNIKKTLNTGFSVKDEAEFNLKNKGSFISVSYSSSPILEEGEIVGAIVVFSDNTERKAQEEKLKELALYDPLTKIPNRASIIAHLEEMIARAQRHDVSFYLCFIDIDKFKFINDTYGHHIGDKALQYVADIITAIIRKNDYFGRLSGDEFCLLLDKASSENEANQVVSKIYSALEAPFVFENISFRLSLSIGIIPYIDGMTSEMLLRKADEAMYQQKNNR